MPRTQVQCSGQVITDIVIRSLAPGYGGLFSRARFLGRLVTSMHVATEPSVIENFLLMKRGDRCTILLRQETERILRAQPFLADATVTAYQDGQGVRLEVETVDESSVVGSLGVTGETPYVRALSFGNGNFRGKGILASAGWRNGDPYRDTFLTTYRNYQLFSRPYQMHLRAARKDHGYDVTSIIAYPFFSDVQPFAWRVSAGFSEDFINFRAPDSPRLSLGLRREYADAGGLIRLGSPGQLGLVGLTLSAERATPAPWAVIVTDSGLVRDPGAALDGRYESFRATRVNLLVAYRQVTFLRVTGFDALSGVQDVRRGLQLGATVGRSLPVSEPRNEVYTALNLYLGVGSRNSFGALEVNADARRDAASVTEPWDGLLTSGRLGVYLKPHSRHTVITSVEYSAGWRQRLPFQLSLGDARGGVRGYEEAELGGGRRIVGRLEERWRVGTIRGNADAGIAFFADVGKLWAGDVPLGRNTGLKPSLGVGLLGALPPRSRRLWRLDMSFPLSREAGARWMVRITSDDRTRAFWIEPSDVRRNHERTMPVSAYTWR